MSDKVVITGLGVISPIGIGLDPYWQALLDRASGIQVRPGFEEVDLPFRLWGPVNDFDGRQYVKPRKALKVMCRPIQFGFAAARMASEHAGLAEGVADPDRIGTVFGTDAFFAEPTQVIPIFQKCIENGEYVEGRWGEIFMKEIEPLWMLKYLPNMVASHISIANDARGPSNSICHGNASGLFAIIEGSRLIQRGMADVVVTGGTSSPLGLTGMTYRGSTRLSKRLREPHAAVRPFDTAHDGNVLAEGAAAVVLESEQHAKARGATILARLMGSNSAFADPTQNCFSGTIEYSLGQALAEAGRSPADLMHVNANGSCIPSEDAAEASGIRAIAGDVPVVANKGNFGDMSSAAPSLEFVAMVLSLQNQQVPATLNHETTAPDCPINVVSETSSLSGNTAAKVSVCPTGQVATVVIGQE